MSSFKNIFTKKKKKHNKLQNNDSTFYLQEPILSSGSIQNYTDVDNKYESVENDNTTSEHEDKKLTFSCELAHGSIKGIINSFSNVEELYEKVSECHGIPKENILFCTLNTPNLDMDRLLGSQIGLEDFIFAHVKGQRKVVEMVKTVSSLGLTITDNGTGYCFIKRIKPGSICESTSLIGVGDLIEKINEDAFVGRRHFDVAKRLQNIPVGASFILELVAPKLSPMNDISSRPTAVAELNPTNLGSGQKTIRLRGLTKTLADHPEEQLFDPVADAAIRVINELIEGILGVEDKELAHSIWELADSVDNPHRFTLLLDQEMGDFDFPDDLVFDFWGAMTDAKAGRITSTRKENTSL